MASNYEWVSYGSSGNAVRKVQQLLNRNGYHLEEDGVFGNLTRSAVLDYQKQNGLRIIDGVVGDETWGHLLANTAPAQPTTSAQVLSGVSDETSRALSRLEQGFTPSDETQAIYAEYDALQGSAPAAYQSAFTAELARLYDEIAGREPFRYDSRSDPLYESYAEQYARQGRAAMEDTLGRAAALTGGYGSSYASAAASQAYGDYLAKLNDMVPQLAAEQRKNYEAQGAAMEKQYEMLLEQDQAAYRRYLEDYDRWRTDTDSALKRAREGENRDMELYRQMLNYYADKAAAEQKASAGTVANTGAVSASAPAATQISATASASVQRAVESYLKSGNTEAAEALAQQYGARMNAQQQQKLAQLLRRYGRPAVL